MTIRPHPLDLPRRKPVDWRRYSVYARKAQRKLGRKRHPLLATIIGSLVLAVAGSLFAQAVGVGIGAGIQDLAGSVASAIPQGENSEIEIGEQPITVSTAPILDTLPEFLKENNLTFEGRIPSFALKPDSEISISLNGKHVTTVSIAPDGRFGGIPLQLEDGPNVIQAKLVEGTTEIALTSHTVFVDRVAPELTIVRPLADEAITGEEIIVEGSTEAAADVTVNDRAVRPNPDGTFTERLLAAPGPFKITITSKDRAGNETKTEMEVIVSEATAAPVAGMTLLVTLDRVKVQPGGAVIAEILAIQDGGLLPDVVVTVQVGVQTIGTYRTDETGTVRVPFAAPQHEAENVAVVVVGGGTSARATLTVAR